MIATFRALLVDEAGAALVEYAIVASAVAAAMIATMTLIGQQTGTQLSATNNSLSSLVTKPQ